MADLFIIYPAFSFCRSGRADAHRAKMNMRIHTVAHTHLLLTHEAQQANSKTGVLTTQPATELQQFKQRWAVDTVPVVCYGAIHQLMF